MRIAIAASVVALALGACGGGGGDEAGPTTTADTAPGALTVTVPEDTATVAEEPTGSPTFDVRLTAESESPTAGRPWRYTVQTIPATVATAKIRIFVGGSLVDTVGFFGFEGRLVRTHLWPPSLRGESDVVFQAEVEGEGGTQRANLAVDVG